MKKFAKLLVLLLTVALIAGAIAIVAGAEENTFDLVAAIKAANDGDTVKLEGNATVETQINITKNLTVDLNGYTITSSAASAFALADAKTLNIIGEGNITLAGNLVSVNVAGANFYIEGTSLREKIEIIHTGTAANRFVYAGAEANGTVSFNNVNVETTYNTPVTSHDVYFVRSDGNTNFIFNNFNFYCGVAYISTNIDGSKKSDFTNHWFANVANKSTVTVTNSVIDTTGNGIRVMGYMDNASDVHITLKNSTLRACAKDALARTMAFGYEMWGNYPYSKGTILVKDSVVEANYAFFNGGKEDGNDKGGNALTESWNIVDVQNSAVSLHGTDADIYEQFTISRGAHVKFDATSRLYSPGIGVGNIKYGKIKLAEGMRLSMGTNIVGTTIKNHNLTFPDGSNASTSTSYGFVFDPATDPTYPWVIVKLNDGGALPEGVTDLSAGFTVNTNFWHFDFSDNLYKITSDANRAYYMAGNGAYWLEGGRVDAEKGLFAFNKYLETQAGLYGTINSTYVNGNEAFTYWVTPAFVDGKYEDATTRDYSDKDNYFVIGDNRQKKILAKDYKVIVFDIDIGTVSGEFPHVSAFRMNSRTSSGNSSASSNMSITPDGTLEFLGDKHQLSLEEWNRITVVCYTDNTYNAKGTTYYYLDGKFIGESGLYGTFNDTTFVQGFRINLNSGIQNVGASIAFDNFTIRAYTDYIDASEADSSGALKTPAHGKYNFFKSDANYQNRYTNPAAAVNGIAYKTVNEALAAAKITNSAVTLLRDVSEKITNPGIILANGYTLAATEGSLPADVKLDENNNVLSYDFDEKYKGELVYYWYVGSLDEYDEEAFESTTVSVGQVPQYEFQCNDFYNIDEKLIMRQTGWVIGDTELSDVPLTSAEIQDYISQNGSNEVWVTPLVSELTMAQVVVDAEGNCVYATDSTEFTLKNIQSGETIKLFTDCEMYSTQTVPEGIVGIDVCGNKMTINGQHPGITIHANTTLNVYSSVEGGRIEKLGVSCKQNETSQVVGGNALFYMLAVSENDAKTVEFDGNDKAYAPKVAGSTLNAKLNLGTVEGVAGADGKNLTVSGDAVVEPRVGDYSCEVNVKDTTLIKVGDNYGALIFPRFYNGTINVEGSTLINASDNDAIISSGNSNVTVSGKTYSNLYQSVVTVKDSVLINTSKDKPVSTDFKSIGSISYENTIVFGRFCRSDDVEKVTIGENVYCSNNDSNFTTSQFVRYNQYIAPEIVKDEGFYKLQSPKLVSNTAGAAVNYDRYLYIVSNGKEAPEGAENVITLDTLLVVSPVNKETVTVNFKDLEGNVLKTEVYAKGGTVLAEVQASKVKDVDFVAMKKTFASWPELPENVTENMDILPEYDVVSTVDGVKANISLYSDFDVNLYIPEIYRDLVTVKYDEKTLDKLATAREGYFKVTVDQLASEAASNVQFEVTVTEANEEFTLNYSVNVANYAKYILEATEGYTEADKTLMEYVVAYANEAYKYANGGKANETLNTLATTYEATPTNPTYVAVQNPAEISAVVTLCNVVLESAPKFVFTIDKEFVGTVVIGGTAYTYETKDEADRVVSVEGTKAYNFLDDITIKVGEAEGKYNYSAYAAYHVDNAENGTAESGKEASANALALINALYEYVNYAKTYNANK